MEHYKGKGKSQKTVLPSAAQMHANVQDEATMRANARHMILAQQTMKK